MKVKELIKELEKVAETLGNKEIIMSSDFEGNGYHKIYDIEQMGKRFVLVVRNKLTLTKRSMFLLELTILKQKKMMRNIFILCAGENITIMLL